MPTTMPRRDSRNTPAMPDTLGLAAGYLDNSPLQALIGGRWVDAEDRATLTTFDPGTAAPLAKVPAMGRGVSPALVAGNTVVIKPAEDTPLSDLMLGRIAEEAGIPAGVINVVTGTGEAANAALAGHPGLKRTSFTGSPEVGRLVAEARGRNLVPVKLDLGGMGGGVLSVEAYLDYTRGLSVVRPL